MVALINRSLRRLGRWPDLREMINGESRYRLWAILLHNRNNQMKIRTNLTFARIICATLAIIFAPQALLSQTIIHFVDRNLEQAVRDGLQKPVGDLTSEDLLQLTSLYAPNYRITDLSGLEAASNLSILNVTQNEITNANALVALPQLTSLNVSYNYVRNLSPILGLTNLTSLFLEGNGIETVPGLGDVRKLAELDLAYNHIRDPVPLRWLTSLRSLNMTGNPISSLAALCQMTNLETLSLGYLAITNANGLSCFVRLLSLDLTGNPVSDWTPLSGLTNLQSLGLTGQAGCDWTPVAGLTNLADLSVYGGALTNLDWLARLGNLRWLSLSRCSLTNIESLARLSGLSYLALPENSISDTSGLGGLTNLVSLDLSKNALTNFAGLAALTNLQVLYLNGNSMTTLTFLTGLPQLIGLDLTWNRIADLTPVGGLTNLSWLQTSFNALTNIAGLRALPELTSVSLNGNLLDLAEGSDAMGIIHNLQSNGVTVYYQPQLEPPLILMKPLWVVPAGQKSWLTFLTDRTYSWVQAPSVAAHSSDPQVIPEPLFVSTPPSDYHPREFAVTPPAGRAGRASLRLAATNYAGLWTNVTVEVQVVIPSTINAEVLDAPGLWWSCGGNPPWFGEEVVSHDGLGALQSGTADSWLQTTVNGPGTLKFWFRLGSDYYYGNGQFTAISQDSDLHGYEHLHRRGEAWQEQIVGLPAGEWTLRWSPSWDSWDFCGVNTVWLDQVSFTPGAPACWLEPYIYEVSTGGHDLSLHGVLGQTYEVEVSNDLQTWSPLTRVTCDNFETSFRDWKVDAAARFYRARQVP